MYLLFYTHFIFLIFSRTFVPTNSKLLYTQYKLRCWRFIFKTHVYDTWCKQNLAVDSSYTRIEASFQFRNNYCIEEEKHFDIQADFFCTIYYYQCVKVYTFWWVWLIRQSILKYISLVYTRLEKVCLNKRIFYKR